MKTGKPKNSLPIHPLADLLPRMGKDDLAALRADIEINGQIDPVVLFEKRILDGRHRDEVMHSLGKKTKTVVFKGTAEQAFALVCSKSIRRNMTTTLKAWAAANCYPHFEAQAIHRKIANGGKKADRAKLPTPPESPDISKGRARDLCGEKFGIPGRTVADSLMVKFSDPKEFELMGQGEKTLAQCKRAVHCKRKRELLVEKAALSPTTGNAEIIDGDCVKTMRTMPRGKVRLVFADPMYNIDYEYGEGKKRDRVRRQSR